MEFILRPRKAAAFAFDMPQRFLRPGIRTSPRWNSVSHAAARLYISILTQVDDWGRYDGRNSVLHSDAFAVWNEQNPSLVVSPQESAALSCELSASSLLFFYEVDGRKYLQLIQWEERARGKSKWPSPPKQLPQESAAERSGTQPNPASLVIAMSHRHEPSPSGVSDVVQLVADPPLVRLMTLLNTAYQRSAKQAWNYTDEQAAVDAIKRDGWESELELILKHRRKLSPDDRKFYAPSVFSCLSKFDEWLDKARAQKIEPIKSSPPPEPKGTRQDETVLKKFAEQIAAQRKEFA